MSQPPQFPSNDSWGQSSGNDSWGQSSNNGSSGYGSSGYGSEQSSSGGGGDFLYGGSANSGDDQPLPGPPAPDQAPQYSQGSLPMGGPPPQQSSGGGKGKIFAIVGCVGCAALTLILVVIIGGVVLLGGGGEDGGPTDSGPTTSQEGSEDGSQEGGSGATSTETGTLEEPNPAGTTVTMELSEIDGTVDVSYDVTWDAEETLKAEDPSLEPAPAGQVYVLVTGTYTYHGTGELDPSSAMYVTYYNDAGTEVPSEIVLTENSIISVEPAADGESTEYDQVYLVPADEVETGTIEVSELFNLEAEPTYIAAA